MADISYGKITLEGLWKNNPALVQLLGLCPLLAVTNSVVNSLGLAFATMLVLVGSNISVSLIRHYVSDAVRLPAFVMIIASFTTVTELLMRAYVYELAELLTIFIALIVTNCTILGRADAFASKNPVLPAALDGFMMSFGFGVVLVLLGAIREVLGTGVLFADMQLLFGDMAKDWTVVVFADYKQFLLAVLPPGAFITMGFLIALKSVIDGKLQEWEDDRREAPVTGSKRVRVTGNVS